MTVTIDALVVSDLTLSLYREGAVWTADFRCQLLPYQMVDGQLTPIVGDERRLLDCQGFRGDYATRQTATAGSDGSGPTPTDLLADLTSWATETHTAAATAWVNQTCELTVS